MKEAKEIRASMIVIECPECGYENEGFVSDPRGTSVDCEHCETRFLVDEEIKINLS